MEEPTSKIGYEIIRSCILYLSNGILGEKKRGGPLSNGKIQFLLIP